MKENDTVIYGYGRLPRGGWAQLGLLSIVPLIALILLFTSLVALTSGARGPAQEESWKGLEMEAVLLMISCYPLAIFLSEYDAYWLRSHELRVSDFGIAAFSRFGKIEVTWDQIRRANILRCGDRRVLGIQFETGSGDFVIHSTLRRLKALVQRITERLADRVEEARASRRKINMRTVWKCSHCGGKFVGTTCTFCEVPRGEDEAAGVK